MKRPKIKVATMVGDPVNNYISTCCTAKATKPPLLMPRSRGVGAFGSSPDPTEQGTLGKFRCTTCKKRCKVTVIKNRREDEKAGN